MQVLEEFFNQLSYHLRKKIKWTRGLPSAHTVGPALKISTRQAIQKQLEAAFSQIVLQQTEWFFELSEPDFWFNIFVLEQFQAFNFEKYLANISIFASNKNQDLKRNENETFQWLDVGCKNLSYLPAFYSAAKIYSDIPHKIILTGIELDTYQIYSNFYSRIDYAHFYQKLLAEKISQIPNKEIQFDSKYIEANWLNINTVQTNHYHLISAFLPFVKHYSHLKWGLPKNYFNPEIYFQNISASLRPEGFFLMTNLNAEEWHAAHRYCEVAHLRLLEQIPFESKLIHPDFDHKKRILSVWSSS